MMTSPAQLWAQNFRWTGSQISAQKPGDTGPRQGGKRGRKRRKKGKEEKRKEKERGKRKKFPLSSTCSIDIYDIFIFSTSCMHI